MFINIAFIILSATLAVLAAPTEQDAGVVKCCFSNGGGWYWCAIDEETPDAEDSIASSPVLATPTAEVTGLSKCCFSNGGGWYWCAIDKETPEPEKSDASGPILAIPAAEGHRTR
ncbi:hypothetical protein B0H14DRAFT_3523965 [Mycena olivaceomarginata]|nr:hypothetical protein B0H14DRAFT_3523965 [Mycena olivaceomarginata]